MEFIISQIVGFIVTLILAASIQCKNVKKMLTLQFTGNAFSALSYVLLGGFSGCGSSLVAALQTALLYFFRSKNKKVPMWFVMVFVILQVSLTLIVYKTPLDLLAILAAIAATLALAQENLFKFRVLAFVCAALWLVYDLYVGAYTMLLHRIISIISTIVGIIRYDIKKA